jgi:hypothetical protein
MPSLVYKWVLKSQACLGPVARRFRPGKVCHQARVGECAADALAALRAESSVPGKLCPARRTGPYEAAGSTCRAKFCVRWDVMATPRTDHPPPSHGVGTQTNKSKR